jgi:hypothetical protein
MRRIAAAYRARRGWKPFNRLTGSARTITVVRKAAELG